MKLFDRVLVKSVLIAIACLFSVAQVSSDPTDDFGHTLSRSPSASYKSEMMDAKALENVLNRNLDRLPKSQISKLASHILSLCQEYRFDPAFILALIHVESRFKIAAKSQVGALGLMQLMPSTAEAVAKKNGIRYTGPKSLLDPFTNISVGVAYLYQLRERFKNVSPYYHVAAYNMGPSKLNELMLRKGFAPTKTKAYYLNILTQVPLFRHYNNSTRI